MKGTRATTNSIGGLSKTKECSMLLLVETSPEIWGDAGVGRGRSGGRDDIATIHLSPVI